MLAAAESIGSSDSVVGVILGIGVVLTFGGLLLSAVAARCTRSTAAVTVRPRLDSAAGPTAGLPSASASTPFAEALELDRGDTPTERQFRASNAASTATARS